MSFELEPLHVSPTAPRHPQQEPVGDPGRRWANAPTSEVDDEGEEFDEDDFDDDFDDDFEDEYGEDDEDLLELDEDESDEADEELEKEEEGEDFDDSDEDGLAEDGEFEEFGGEELEEEF
jgi:hypothetical protein